jgi:hypothetical protein
MAAQLALVLAAGCTQILGLHERPEATDSGASSTTNVTVAGQCGQLLHSSLSCASCMDQSCCSEARACATDDGCREASACLAACTDAACRAQCAAFYPSPDTLLALRSCRLRQCSTACGSSCGELASPIPDCQQCLESSCCSAATGCATDTSCAALNRCISNCFGAASCPTDCETQSPLGTSDYQTLFGCSNQCAAACQPGQSWACLDTPILWPKPPSVGTITFSVTFVSLTTEEPFIGASVQACSKLDYTCASPLDTATADSTGMVTLTVPGGLSGFDGYLDVTGGQVGGSGASVFPSLWYPVPFVVADGWRGRTLLLSSDEFVALAGATGTTLDPTRGHVGVNAEDCAFGPAAGVTFAVDVADAQTVSFYLVNGVPVTSATATDQSGLAAFVNLPIAGSTRLTVVRASSGPAGGKSMGSLTFVLRPGTLTTSSSFPPMP